MVCGVISGMRKNGAVHRFLLAMAFVAFLGGAFLTVSATTSSRADAWVMSAINIACTAASGGVMDALDYIYTAVTEFSLNDLKDRVSAFFTLIKDNVTEIIKSFMRLISGEIGDAVETGWDYNVLPSLQARTDQMNTMNTEQARAIGNFKDASDQNRVIKEMEEMALDSKREQAPSETVCVAASAVGGLTRAASIARAYNAAAPAERIGRSANSKGVPLVAARAEDMKARFGDYSGRYCDKDENGGAGCPATGAYVMQDIDVAGLVFGLETIDMTSPTVKRAVDDMITNIAEPFIRDPVAKGAIDTPEGQRQLLEGRIHTAKRQVIYDSMYHVVAQALPGSGMKTVADLRKSLGIPESLVSNNPSKREVMHAMMSEKYQSGKYGIQSIDEPENNDRESVTQMGFQLMNLSDMLDALQHQNMLLAAQIGGEIRLDKDAASTIGEVPFSP